MDNFEIILELIKDLKSKVETIETTINNKMDKFNESMSDICKHQDSCGYNNQEFRKNIDEIIGWWKTKKENDLLIRKEGISNIVKIVFGVISAIGIFLIGFLLKK